MHATHGGADDQTQMFHFEAFDQQTLLRLNHVAIAVTGKFGAQPIARLARFTVPEIIGDDDIVPGGVEKLAFAEQFARKFRSQKLATAAGSPMQNQNRVTNDAILALRGAERPIMHPHFGKILSGLEMKVPNDKIAFSWRGIFGGPRFFP